MYVHVAATDLEKFTLVLSGNTYCLVKGTVQRDFRHRVFFIIRTNFSCAIDVWI